MNAQPAPVMPGRFPLGSLREMATDPLGFLTRCERRLGPVVRVRLAWRGFTLISQPDLISAVLVDREGRFRKRRIEFQALGTVVGKGLLTTEGEVWKRQRKLMQPLFTSQLLARYGEDMTALAAAQLERWRPAAKSGALVDLHAGVVDLTLAIAAKTLLGAQFTESGAELRQAILDAIDYADQFENLVTLPAWLPTPRNRRFRQAKALLDRVVGGMIRDRRAHLSEGHDLLAVLVRAKEEDTGLGLSDETLRDQVMTFFLAGHETTAQSLSWLLCLLAQHPEAEAKVRAETGRVLGGRTPTYADLGDLEYSKQTIQEAMRLYPAVWGMGREAAVDVELGGFLIPKGQDVIMSQWVMHRHPAYWENPERFDPDRFSTERGAGRSLGVYFPFGGGPRVCIGQTFAMAELQLLLPMFLQAYRFELDPSRPVAPRAGITLRPADGIWMRLREA